MRGGYKGTLEKDESDLLDLFGQLEAACDKADKETMIASDSLAVKPDSSTGKREASVDSQSDVIRVSDFEMDGTCLASSDVKTITTGMDRKRKLKGVEGS